MSVSPRRSRWIRRGLQGGLLVSIVLLIFAASDLIIGHAQDASAAMQRAQTQGNRVAQTLDRTIGQSMRLAESIAADLGSGKLPYSDIERRLQDDLGSMLDIDGLTVAFAPFAFSADQRLALSYVHRGAAGALITTNVASYDYTQSPSAAPLAPRTDWFYNTIGRGKQWYEPFFATGAGKYLIEYSVPFARLDPADKTPAGVVAIDYSLVGMQSLVRKLDLHDTDYGFIFSPNGTLLAHPQTELIGQSSIFADQLPLFSASVRQAAHVSLDGQSPFVEQRDPQTGQDVWVSFHPITSSGWSLGVVLDPSGYIDQPRDQIHLYVLIALALAAVIFLICALSLRLERGTTSTLWKLSAIFSVLCLLLMSFIWFFSHIFLERMGTVVLDQATVARYRETTLPGQSPITISTGIRVNSIVFPDARTMLINGYLWQRYPDSVPSDVERGVTLEQWNGDQQVMTEIKRVKEANDTYIAWSFGMSIMQNGSPERFPFDERDVAVRIVPLDINHPIMLVPDFAAYPSTDPARLPGLDSELKVSTWEWRESFYAYRQLPAVAPLGLSNDRAAIPALYFNVAAQRYPIGPLVSYLLPAVVVTILLFAYLISDWHRHQEPNVLEVLSFTAAIFFVISVIHSSLRESVDAIGIIYLGWLYILLYFIIAALVVNVFLVVHYPQLGIVHLRNNLLAKVLYWPLLLGIYLIITLVMFVFTAS